MTSAMLSSNTASDKPEFNVSHPDVLDFLYRASFQHMKWKTNWCHYFNFIHISTDLYMFRAPRCIFRRVHTAVHTTIGSVSVPFWSRALYVVAGLGDCSLLSTSRCVYLIHTKYRFQSNTTIYYTNYSYEYFVQ